ncbi:MAG: metalloregulator ArsR/SmtB family transcription factor [Planctomycetes bacterium]|nr:metalloregulator ArsR/SmtB family transcription factor [Planctomycetota bacterium]
MPDLDAYSDLCRTFGEPARLRILALLAEQAFTVAELTAITGLTQSRVSTHLARLREAGLAVDRRDGASSYWVLNDAAMPESARRAWELARTSIDDAVLEEDRLRVAQVLRARAGGASWADSVAGQMDRHYSPGRTWEALARATLGFARLGDVLDVASGDGLLAEVLAARARSITCVDLSPRVVHAGARRLHQRGKVRFVQGDMHRLPLADESFDQVALLNALVFTARPELVLDEVCRLLRPGGTLVVATLRQHEHHAPVERYGHLSHGTTPPKLRSALERRGLAVEHCAITSREARPPHFESITAHATKLEAPLEGRR